MNKKILILLILLCCLNTVYGASTIEVSDDNITFRTANTVFDGGIVSVVGLECDTIYHFRINEGTGFQYYTQKTEVCGLSQMEIALLIFLSVLIIGGLTATIMTNNFMRLVYALFTGLVILVTLNITANLAESNDVGENIINVLWTFYTVSLWLYVFAFFIVLILLIIYLRIRRNPPPHMGSPLQDSTYMRR